MGFSIWHFLLFMGIILIFWGPAHLPRLGKALGESVRAYRKGVLGEGDIDVTDSLKRIEKDNEN